MKKLISILLLIFLSLLVGCTQQPEPVPVTAIVAPTNTLQPPGATLTETTQPEITDPTSTPDKIQALLANQNTETPTVPRPTPIPMPGDSLKITSPDGKIEVIFGLIEGVPYYSVNRAGVDVILPSKLGFTF